MGGRDDADLDAGVGDLVQLAVDAAKLVRQVGNIEVPQSAFLAVLKLD